MTAIASNGLLCVEVFTVAEKIKRRIGRPPRTDKPEVVNVYLSEKLLQRLERFQNSQAFRPARSRVLERALEEYLDREEKKSK